MIAKATLKYLRISPRKADLLVRLIRGKSPHQAIDIVKHANKKMSEPLGKLIKSVIHNAENKGYDVKTSGAFISKAAVSPGPTLKRFRSAAFGRATQIRKRTSHIDIELDVVSKKV